jgi:hypothetical protein
MSRPRHSALKGRVRPSSAAPLPVSRPWPSHVLLQGVCGLPLSPSRLQASKGVDTAHPRGLRGAAVLPCPLGRVAAANGTAGIGGCSSSPVTKTRCGTRGVAWNVSLRACVCWPQAILLMSRR